ncbi:MAG: nucleic acid-binding protein [Clostridia bacterium]|nr:nucleic acid-binding protein [Clostridia bacterium]
MKKCIRCNTEMIENLIVNTNDAMGLSVGEKGLFKKSLGKVSAAVCPKCGYLETYINNPEKLDKYD